MSEIWIHKIRPIPATEVYGNTCTPASFWLAWGEKHKNDIVSPKFRKEPRKLTEQEKEMYFAMQNSAAQNMAAQMNMSPPYGAFGPWAILEKR